MMVQAERKYVARQTFTTTRVHQSYLLVAKALPSVLIDFVWRSLTFFFKVYFIVRFVIKGRTKKTLEQEKPNHTMGAVCGKSQILNFAELEGGYDLGMVHYYSHETHDFDQKAESNVFLLDCITSVGYADIYKGRIGSDPVLVARFNPKACLSAHFDVTTKEIKRYAEMQHTNIFTITAASFDSTNFCFVSKYFSMGTLETAMKTQKAKLTPKIKFSILSQVAEGLHYLHTREPPILHHNIRPASIWVHEDWGVALGEFGFEKIKAEFRTQSLDSSNYVYRDPNIYKGGTLTAESDVYSIGILMWEVWTCKTPFEGYNNIKISNDLVRGARPDVPTDMPEAYVSLMKKAWDMDKKVRPSIQNITEGLKSFT